MARKRRNSVNQQAQPELPRDYNAAARMKQVAELRLAGLEFAEIAVRLGYKDKSGAWRAWKKYLSQLPTVETEQARLDADARLNVLLYAVWDKAKGGDMWAIDRALAIEKRRAELLGLDIVRSPAGRPPEEVRREYYGVDVADLIARANPPVSANGRSADPLHN